MASARTLRLPNGRRFEYVVAGRGPRTLIVHPGGPGLTSEYLSNLLRLAGRGRRVVLFHPRGVGRSYRPRSARAYTLAALVEDLDAARNVLHLDQFDLLGFSAGGFVAIEYALAHSEALRSLLLCGTAASAADLRSANRLILRRATRIQRKQLRELERARAFRTRAYQKLTEELGQPFQTRYLRAPSADLAASRLNPAVYCAMMTRTGNEFVVDGTLARWDARPRLRRLRLPTLVLVGQDDLLYPSSRGIDRRIPGSVFVALPRASHLANLERPLAFRSAVRKFLRSARVAGRPGHPR